MRRLHHDVEILLVHPALEARFEITVQHALTVVFEDFRVGKTAEQRFSHLAAVDAVFRGKSKSLGHGQHAHAGHDLVGRLGYLTSAAVADVDDILAHAFESRLGRIEGRHRTTGHDRQRTGDGTDLATGDRGIDEIDTGRCQFGMNGAGRRRGDGAHIDGHQPGASALRHAAHDFGDVRCISHH